MQADVVAAMKWAWNGYRDHAMGHDSLDVINMNGTAFSDHDLAISLADSLDTLFLLGLHDDFDDAATWAEANLPHKFDGPGKVSLFETTIRVLGRIKLGAGGDSYYEYLLKQWVFSGKRQDRYRDMYETAVTGIMDKLVGRTKKSGWVFLGELEVNGDLTPKMDHLVCFMPGMLALGYMHGMPSSHLDLAKALGRTCFEVVMSSA
ncbi:hypothetical protein DYB37_005021 [Aphanomyces astaci]|uniref:alpha-1,2-Mannosidase n=1 Tax=Aphanomyces astaci TaxID=112090 RepID=A0A418DUK9_APHAT|nr:hypothetical protein DYB35_004143 [Aphanomyces astaci]RHZ11473.1 hypothetical protein DYB37_005021 [Aphanomyces astaci]